jgi:hypothetical protein
MTRMREKYGSGVVGLPLWLRIVATMGACAPSAFWFATSLVTEPPWTALTLACGVLLAFPVYLIVPRLWERTEESVRSDWTARRVQKWLELEIGVRELTPRVDHDPDRPIPRRW